MKEYEIHVGASYTTSGGSKEWNAFTEYLEAASAAEAKRILKAQLKADGYHNITMKAIEAEGGKCNDRQAAQAGKSTAPVGTEIQPRIPRPRR